jgi:hypothetical protein
MIKDTRQSMTAQQIDFTSFLTTTTATTTVEQEQ